jgi:L-ascorbate metabolism protein UlaG (beta-lactamase superfamily)
LVSRHHGFVGPKRVNDPGIAFADLPPINVVLVSRGHYDHLDVRTLKTTTKQSNVPFELH